MTTLRSEEEVQVALKHWLRPLCSATNIQLARESLTGRGFLDFKFSIGHDLRCLAEVKLFSSSRLQDGIGIQLPTYMLADKTRYGVYVPDILGIAGIRSCRCRNSRIWPRHDREAIQSRSQSSISARGNRRRHREQTALKTATAITLPTTMSKSAARTTHSAPCSRK